MNINKTDLINALAEKKSYKKYAIKNAIDDIFEEIAEALVRGDKVSLRGFGTFEPKMFQSHPAVHPGTGERIMVESYKNVVFRPGDELIRMVREEK